MHRLIKYKLIKNIFLKRNSTTRFNFWSRFPFQVLACCASKCLRFSCGLSIAIGAILKASFLRANGSYVTKTQSILYIFIISMLAITLNSCTKAIIDEGESDLNNQTIKFNPHVKDIMFNYCVTCHGGASPAASLSLTDYNSVRSTTENGNLLNRINDEEKPMPPSGLLSEANRQLIEKWVADGYLEN